MINKYLGICLVFVVILSSCGEETIEVDGTIAGKEYFPVEVGKEWVYSTDSIIYDASMGTVDTFSGFVREVILEQIDDESYSIGRSFRRSEDDGWALTDIWTTRVEERRAIRTEENLSFIRLIFPPTLDSHWDGNSLFDDEVEIVVAGEPLDKIYQLWEYRITSVSDTYTLDEDTTFSDVIIVLEVDEDDDFLAKRYSQAKYAKNVGMIERTMSILECGGCTRGIPWEQKAERGFILTQKLLSYK